MSFRMFIYYCALCGGWSGLIGWVAGNLFAPEQRDPTGSIVVRAGVQGMFLGLAVALGLGLLDTLWNLSIRDFGQVILRVLTAALVGVAGGFASASLGQLLYAWKAWSVFFLFGWTIVGLLVGMSVGLFEWIHAAATGADRAWARKKILRCTGGGMLGGLLGGLVALGLRHFTELITDKAVEQLRSPTAIGFIALGAAIGLLAGLAQVMLKEVWIKVEAGFRPGREMILSKERTTIGRAEGTDIALFGDNGVEKLHACIVQEEGVFFLEDTGTAGGTYVNDVRVQGRQSLRAGDLIRLGKSLLRFNERVKGN